MRSFLLAITLLPFGTAQITVPEKTVTYGRSFANLPVPTFDKGYLIAINRPNGLEVWGPDGQLVFRTALADPPSALVTSVAIDTGGTGGTGGTVAVGFSYSIPQGYAGGIAFLDRSGKQIRKIDTARYLPSHLCFDKNHRLWTFGFQRDAVRNETEDREDYLLFRQYSSDGRPLGAFISRSLFPKPGLSPGGSSGGLWRIRAMDDRIGALANAGSSGVEREWIEITLEGQLIGHWKMGPNPMFGTAALAKLGVCEQVVENRVPRVDCLDRETGTWKALSNRLAGTDGRPLGNLLGADGDSLVFSQDHGNTRLIYVKIPAKTEFSHAERP